MQSTRLVVLNRQIIRNFCISCTKHGHYSARESKFLTKILHGRSRRKWYNEYESASNPAFHESPKRAPSIHVQRRMSVLNKIFMEHITDLMSTGDAGSEILERNIEVSHVEVSPDFKIINVFWIDNIVDPESHMTTTEQLLHNCAKSLRHHLSQLRVIGNVPPIHFVKCKHINKVKEVERRLRMADFGEDFEPAAYPYSPNAVVTYKDNSIKSKEDSVSEPEGFEKKGLKREASEEAFCITLPVMRHDVFSLDRHNIMSKIKIALDKSKAMTKKQSQRTKTSDKVSNKLQDQNFLTDKELKDEFSEFLIRRKKEERRKYKIKRKCSQDRNVFIIDDEDIDNDYDTSYEIEDDISSEEYSDYEYEP